MEPGSIATLWAIASPFVVAGLFLGGMKVTLNGTLGRVERIDLRTEAHGLALARVEERQENLEQRLDRIEAD